MDANFLNQSYSGYVRSEDMPLCAIFPSMGTLMALTNEIRVDRTIKWQGCAVPGIVENEQTFIFGTKGQRSADKFEATTRAPGLFTGLVISKRIGLGWLALDNCGGRSWWLWKD